MRLVALLTVISAVTPRIAHACSPGLMSVRMFWPEDGVLPANGSVWIVHNVGRQSNPNWMPSVQFRADDGSPITTTAVNRPVDRAERYTLSNLSRLIRVDAPLEPHRAYTLEYSSSSTVTSQFQITTTEPDTSAPSPPESIELMFIETFEEPELISSCSGQLANEVSVVFLHPAAGTSWILASAMWPDGSQTDRPRLKLLSSLDQTTFTFWGADQGVPCTRFISVGPGGTESAPVEMCQASACGDRDSFNWSYHQWTRSGGSCEEPILDGSVQTMDGGQGADASVQTVEEAADGGAETIRMQESAGCSSVKVDTSFGLDLDSMILGLIRR